MLTQPTTQVPTLLLAHLRETARSAHNNISMRPDQRGDGIIRDYSEELAADIAQIITWGTQGGAEASVVEETAATYRADYERQIRTWLGAISRCASWFVCGPANFPVERMRKRSETADRRYNDFREWRRKGLKRAERLLIPKAEVDELAEAKTKLEARQRDQDRMKEGNKIIRGKETEEAKTAKLVGMGFSPRTIHDALHPQYGRTGFPAWMLSNNNAEIRRLTDRVKELEQKREAGAAVGGRREVAFDGGVVVLNYDEDRVQITHDAKPDEATRNKLKSGGWRWSPTAGAWQRKITHFAIQEAQWLTGAELLPRLPVPAASLFDATRAAVTFLKAAWENTGQPYPQEVETLVAQALNDASTDLLAAAEELSAVLPDASFATRHNVPRHIVECLTNAIRKEREDRAAQAAQQPEEEVD